MSEEQQSPEQGPEIALEDHQAALAAREKQEAEAEQAARMESEKERLKMFWIQAGGTEEEFEAEAESLISSKRFSDVLERDRRAQAEVDAHYQEVW